MDGELPRRDPSAGKPHEGFSPSTDGDANEQWPSVNLEQLRDAMETEGFGTNIMDPETGEVLSRPAARTPLDDLRDEVEGTF